MADGAATTRRWHSASRLSQHWLVGDVRRPATQRERTAARADRSPRCRCKDGGSAVPSAFRGVVCCASGSCEKKRERAGSPLLHSWCLVAHVSCSCPRRRASSLPVGSTAAPPAMCLFPWITYILGMGG